MNYLDELIRPVPSGENGDMFPIPSFGVRQVVCQRGIGDSLSTSRKLICRVLEENGQDSWPASRDIDLPQPPKQSLTCFPCPYFILCSLMLVLFDISFISWIRTLIHFWEHYINTVLYLNIQISPAALETTLLSRCRKLLPVVFTVRPENKSFHSAAQCPITSNVR